MLVDNASKLTLDCFVYILSALKKGSRCANNWFRRMTDKVFLVVIASFLQNLLLISSMHNTKKIATMR